MILRTEGVRTEGAAQVVLTGVGVVSPCGIGPSSVADALASGATPRCEVDRSAGYHREGGSRLAAMVPPGELGALLPPREGRRMSAPSRFAVAAARLAIEDARLTASEVSGDRTAVVLATSYGPTLYSERIVRQLLAEGPVGVSPLLFTESVANAPAAQVALKLDARGPNVTVTQREAGALVALKKGMLLLQDNRADRVLVGGADEASPLLHAVLDRFGALSPGLSRCGEEVACPFDRDRSGFVLGEGATVWVLERAGDAGSRGAPVQATVEAVVRVFDPDCSPHGWSPSGEKLGRSLSARLGDRRIDLSGVTRVVSHGNGSLGGDRAEAGMLSTLFAGARSGPEILAPGANLGEYCANTLAVARQALSGGEWAPTSGFVALDPELGVAPWAGGSMAPTERLLLSISAIGGACALALLSRGE